MQRLHAAVWVLNPMELNKKVGYGEYVPPISYDSLRGDLEGAFSNQDNDDNESQGKIIACHGVGCDLRMYTRLIDRWQPDYSIHTEDYQWLIQYGNVPTTYWTSQWSFIQVN